MTKYQVKLIPVAGSYLNEVYVYKLHGNSAQVLHVKDGDLQVTAVPIDQTTVTEMPRFMRGTDEDIKEVLKALEDLRLPLGVPEPTKEYNTGKLEATERHLEDMRTIVFKKTE